MPREQLGVWCLAQGHLSHDIEGGEIAEHSLPRPQFLPARDLNSQPLDYKFDSLTIRPRLPHLYICLYHTERTIDDLIFDPILLAYKAKGIPYPMGIRAHSTKDIAAYPALENGTQLADICRATAWT